MRLFSLMLVCSLFFYSGCATTATKTHYYKPLNIIQEDFYAIQTIFNSGQYSDTIELGEKFIEAHPRDILTVSIRYYIGSSYQELGEYAKAKEYFNSVLKTNSEDDWGKLARVGLSEIKDK